ncbi:LysM peptidoglycan-binding domain-containing protein [Paenibacillus albus]|uniref:LysM peptidoglycan-binding domain-containing protein n=1 Tax=Paenibacillus albus TaxID=2495582 RepID=A0A3S9A863_9BACL|nr:LysM peptidoglycan-binding domain-containing protein [Paenibacillus albus]AZN41979.1 LysM peptidoglycan-binding domain-containing protein [Paenibacillus albus]
MMTTISSYSTTYKGNKGNSRTAKRQWNDSSKQRLLLRLAVTALLFVLLFTGLTLMTSYAGSEHPAAPTATEQVVVIGAGDTLWDIAGRVRESGQDIREVVYSLKKRNNLTSSTLQAGQSLIVPAE